MGIREEPHSEHDGARALSMAVLERAMADLVSPDSSVSPRDHEEAKRFMFAEEGPWAARREELCLHVDVEPEWYQRKARELLEANPKAEPEPVGSREWDLDVIIEHLTKLKLVPGRFSSKAPLVVALQEAGFCGPRRGPITWDNVFLLMRKRPEHFFDDRQAPGKHIRAPQAKARRRPR